MFSIDLLKGNGIPIKSTPAGIALVGLTVAMPVIVAIAMLASYLSDKVIISVDISRIAGVEKMVNSDELEHAVRVQQLLNSEQSKLKESLAEVSSVINRHTQWTPVLETIIKNMPDSMVLTTIEVKIESIKTKRPKENEPQKMVDVVIPIRVLHMSMLGNFQINYDKALRDFRDNLLYDEILGPKLEEIRVAQEFDKVDDKEVASYEIYLVFKPAF